MPIDCYRYFFPSRSKQPVVVVDRGKQPECPPPGDTSTTCNRYGDRASKALEHIELKCYSLTEGCALIDANHRYRFVYPKYASPAKLATKLEDSRSMLDVRPQSVSLIRLTIEGNRKSDDRKSQVINIERLPGCDSQVSSGSSFSESSGLASLESCDRSGVDGGRPGAIEEELMASLNANDVQLAMTSSEDDPALDKWGNEAAKTSERSVTKDDQNVAVKQQQHGHSLNKKLRLRRKFSKLLNYIHIGSRQPRHLTGSHTLDGPLVRHATKPQATVMISYQRDEGQEYALALHSSLTELGISVYVDLLEIHSGIDWQDSLNAAILGCQAFVALVTPSYGETLWTSREVKLADVKSKRIIPVNFGISWPPTSLAIQFATLQYIPWLHNNAQVNAEASCDEEPDINIMTVRRQSNNRMPQWPADCVASVAQRIARTLSESNPISGGPPIGRCSPDAVDCQPKMTPSSSGNDDGTSRVRDSCYSSSALLDPDQRDEPLHRNYGAIDSKQHGTKSRSSSLLSRFASKTMSLHKAGRRKLDHRRKSARANGKGAKEEQKQEEKDKAGANELHKSSSDRAIAIVSPRRIEQEAVAGHSSPDILSQSKLVELNSQQGLNLTNLQASHR